MPRSPIRVPRWIPSAPGWFAPVWGAAFAAWAVTKLATAPPLMQCGDAGILWAYVAGWMALIEAALGIAAIPRCSRHRASLFGFATMSGLVVFAGIAHVRDLDWKGCSCLWEGLDLPWLPWHALVASALALPFGWIFLDAERRCRTPDAPIRA